MTWRAVSLAACCLALGACSDHLATLRELNPQADDFETALASEYLAYSESEAEQGRIAAAQYYAEKGVRAANREPVVPERANGDTKMHSARETLMALLTQDVKHVNPQAAARAQLLFDCWVAQVGRADSFVPCADEFRSALDDVQSVADFFVHGQEAEHTIHFAPGSAGLNEEARAIIREVAGRVKTIAKYAVELGAGHGPLADKRLNAVRAGLIKRGVAKEHITFKDADGDKAVVLSEDEPAAGTVTLTVRSYVSAKGVAP